MAARIFDTYHAPDEEIAGVKQALDDAGIDWFETTKGRWWVGSAALWVHNERDKPRARAVIDGFQAQWVANSRAEAASNPPRIRWARVPVAIVVVGALLYLMTFWFFL